MTVKFITSTNKAFSSLFNIEVNLNIEMVAYMTFDTNLIDDFNFRHGNARTSTIEKIEYNEVSRGCTEIKITTRNSVYIFQHGQPSDEKPLTKKEMLDLQMASFRLNDLL